MFEALFNYPREAFAEGELVFVNVVDPRMWLLAAGVVAVLIVVSVVFGRRLRAFSWWKKSLVGTLQVSVALGVIVLLAGPHLKTTKLQAGANTVAVLLDTSKSMGFADRDGRGTRLKAAMALYEDKLLDEIGSIAQVSLFEFAAAAQRVEHYNAATAFGEQTRLVESLDTVLQSFRGTPLAGVVVLSDGSDNDVAALTRMPVLASFGVPIHTVGFGPSEIVGEAILADVRAPDDAPPYSQVTAQFAIEHSVRERAPVRVQVRDRGTLLAQTTVEIVPGVPVVRSQISFASGDAGIRELSFSIVPPDSDVLAENNTAVRLLTVNQRDRRVLYLEGEPRWEYKFLRRALQGDDVVELVSWLRTTDRKSYRQGVEAPDELLDGFPATRAELYGYDLVILGSVEATSLTDVQHEWLETYIADRGGSLLALAGRHALADGGWDVRPLARALPVRLRRSASPSYQSGKWAVVVTRAGLDSPLLFAPPEGPEGFATLPEVGDFQILGELKPAASTLLELRHPDGALPLLVTQPYGLGNSAILATATTWRWQMSTPVEDPRHSLFWRQLTRQLAESAPRARSVDLKVDGDSVEILAWARDEEFNPEAVAVTAMVTLPDRSQTQVPLVPSDIQGLHIGRFAPGAGGVSRVDVTVGDVEGDLRNNITRFVQVGGGNQEFTHPVQNAALLQRIAEATGGALWPDRSVAGLGERLSFTGSGVRSIELLPLWNLPLLFALLILLKILEWGLRRLWGGL